MEWFIIIGGGVRQKKATLRIQSSLNYVATALQQNYVFN